MKNLRKTCIVFIFITFLILLTNSVNAASDFTFKELDFNVSLNSDGTMDVVETWNIKVHDTTNTLYKTFILDKSKFSDLENVSVAEVKDGNEDTFTRINEEMYHVTKNCYYGLVNTEGRYEIAWGINEDSGTKTYKVYYTIKDVIKNYNDCSELYWQFIGEDFTSNINKVTGTIKLPSKVLQIDNLRAWAHGQLNGEVKIVDSETVSFNVDSYKKGNFVEIRIATKEDVFYNNANTVNKDYFNQIIDEETVWAEQANEQREEAKRIQLITNIIISVVFALIAVIMLIRIVLNSKTLVNTQKRKPTQEYKYFREKPEKSSSAAGAAFLYYLNKGGVANNFPKVLSATMLNLCLKKKLAFEIEENAKGKQSIKINLIEDENKILLTQTETITLELFKKVNNSGSFTMKQLENFAKAKSDKFITAMDDINSKAEVEQIEAKNFDLDLKNKHVFCVARGILQIVLIPILSMFLGIPLMIEQTDIIPLVVSVLAANIFAITNGIICLAIANRINNGLTQKGIDEKEKWEGLKRYMEDFSLLNEREVPELSLWEEFLVYATAFGVADKVLKQLKIKYSEFSNGEAMPNSAYLHIMVNRNLNMNFVNSLNTAVNGAYSKAIAASSYSSGGGYGGGFSGGGGGGGRWRWRRSVVRNYKFRLKKRKLFSIKKV